MTGQARKYDGRRRDTVRVNGRTCPVLDQVTALGRTWPVLETTANGARRQLKVFDRFAGPCGGLRGLYLLPKSQASRQHIEVLRRVSATSSHLPTILECRHEGRRTVLLVTWIAGSTLREYLAAVHAGRRSATSPIESVRLIRGLAHALAQLHRHRQIIHGDLRPENLILATRPSRLVLIDFGSAWMTEATVRRGHGDGFVPAYAAPELQCESACDVCDCRSDQFATAVILFELLSGQIPYGGIGGRVLHVTDAGEAQKRLSPPSQLALDGRKIPDAVWDAIDAHVIQALALDPDDRFATPAAWLDSLDSLQNCINQSRHLIDRPLMLTRVMNQLARLVAGLDVRSMFRWRRRHE